MSEKFKDEQRRFALNGIKNTGFYYTKSITEGKYKLPILYCLQLDGPTRYLGWKDCGGIYAFDCYKREDIEKTTYPKKAFELGMHIKEID